MNAQTLFTAYTSEASLSHDVGAVYSDILAAAKDIATDLSVSTEIRVADSPMGIAFDPMAKASCFSLYAQAPNKLKSALLTITADEAEAEKVFGLFYQGWFVPHNFTYALMDAYGQSGAGHVYFDDYAANIASWHYWQEKGHGAEVSQCMEWAGKMRSGFPNPIPEGEIISIYLNENRDLLKDDPAGWLYVQAYQLLDIRENEKPFPFREFLHNFLEDLQHP